MSTLMDRLRMALPSEGDVGVVAGEFADWLREQAAWYHECGPAQVGDALDGLARRLDRGEA